MLFMSRIDARLQELGIILPRSSAPAGKYANAVIVNGMMIIDSIFHVEA